MIIQHVVVCDTNLMGAIGIHHVDLAVAVAVARERDLAVSFQLIRKKNSGDREFTVTVSNNNRTAGVVERHSIRRVFAI